MATAALGLLGSSSASALESGFYIGLLGGNGQIDLSKGEYDEYERYPGSSGFSSSLENSDTAIGLVLGGQFGRWFAVETQLIDLGEYSYRASQTLPSYFVTAPRNLDISSTSTVEAAAVTLSGILTVPVGDQFAFGFRLGIAGNATDSNFTYDERRGNSVYDSWSDSNDAESSDVSATYGISFEWDPLQHFGVRLEYQIIQDVGAEDDDYDYDDYDDVEESDGRDVDLISLTLIGRF